MSQSQLNYFNGKIVTILTTPINRNFKEEADSLGKPQLFPANLMDHFVGRFEGYDTLGVMLGHPDVGVGTRAYYFFDKIVGIVEEQELNPDDPQEASVIERYKQIQEAEAQQMAQEKIFCPKGHALDVPPNIPPGSQVACPKCQTQFQMPSTADGASQNKPAPINKSNFVDIDGMSKLAEESKEN